jgi:hypothetical protein
MTHRSARRYRARVVLGALVVALVVLSACGGGSASRAPSGQTDGAGTPQVGVRGSGDCPREDDRVLLSYEQTFDQGVPGGGEFLTITFDSSIQLSSSDKVVGNFLHDIAREGPNPIWNSFTAAHFDTEFVQVSADFTVDDVKYLGDKSAVIVFTVKVDTNASQTPQVLAGAQVSGRLVCEQGFWHVALADVCAILADGTGPPCPKKVKNRAKDALPQELNDKELPEVSEVSVVTVPTTTTPDIIFTPAPVPPSPGFDGVCPYVGQPCSANVTNDPDCTCVPGAGGGQSPMFGFITCRSSAVTSAARDPGS